VQFDVDSADQPLNNVLAWGPPEWIEDINLLRSGGAAHTCRHTPVTSTSWTSASAGDRRAHGADPMNQRLQEDKTMTFNPGKKPLYLRRDAA